MKRRKFSSDTTFNIVHAIFIGLILILYTWPIWFIIIASVSDPRAITNGEVWILPKGFQLDGFRKIFEYKELWVGYRNTILYTVVGTAVNIIATIFAAYPLSRMEFWPRKFLTILYLFTMYFGGGLIPTYIQIKNLGLMNSFWVMIIPSAISIFNVLILRSCFMYSIPKELEEASLLDGAGPVQLLWKIYLPLSKATLAVLVLYYAVGHWNDYITSLFYITDRNLMSLQYIVSEILMKAEAMMGTARDAEMVAEMLRTSGIVKYGVIVITTIPVMLIYPFVQKHFVKGVMIGAVKG